MIISSIKSLEKYSRGRRGAPAKGIGRVTGARVRIPLSPLLNKSKKLFKKTFKKVLTNKTKRDILNELSQESTKQKRTLIIKQ